MTQTLERLVATSERSACTNSMKTTVISLTRIIMLSVALHAGNAQPSAQRLAEVAPRFAQPSDDPACVMPVGAGDLSAMLRYENALEIHLSKTDFFGWDKTAYHKNPTILSPGHARLSFGIPQETLRSFEQRLDPAALGKSITNLTMENVKSGYNARSLAQATELTQLMFDYVAFTGDTGYLKTTVAPWLKEAALFYLSYLRPGDDGLYHSMVSDAAEMWWKIKDPAIDLSAARYLFWQVLNHGATDTPYFDSMGVNMTALQETLLQSHHLTTSEKDDALNGGPIVLVPAARPQWSGRFKLRARGGFLVTAEFETGRRVTQATIECERSGPLRIANPFGECRVAPSGKPAGSTAEPLIVMDTRAGEVIECSWKSTQD